MHLPGHEPWGDDNWGEDPDGSEVNSHSRKGGGYYDLGGGGTPPRGALGWNRGRGPGAIWDAWGEKDDSVEGPLHRRFSNVSTSTRSRKGDGYVDLGGGSPRSSVLGADPDRQVDAPAGVRGRGVVRGPSLENSEGFPVEPDDIPVVGEKVGEEVAGAVQERGQEQEQPHQQHNATNPFNSSSSRSRRGSSGYKNNNAKPVTMYSPW